MATAFSRSLSKVLNYRQTIYCNTSRYLQSSSRSLQHASSRPEFSGGRHAHRAPFTEELVVNQPRDAGIIPMYRVMDEEGNVIHAHQDPNISKEVSIKMYKKMTQLPMVDYVMYESQRQGRISFYMTNYGEEGVQIGSAAALDDKDLVYAQYREAGVIFWRGFGVYGMMSQCYGNADDLEKGRNMPVHYGNRDLHFVSISSTLATQMPQAVGSAYAYKRAKNNLCVACYFGEGAASEGDAHPAFNFAATLDCPIIFIWYNKSRTDLGLGRGSYQHHLGAWKPLGGVDMALRPKPRRNNGYAISTPSSEQFRGDGIASRGTGYGMATIRVDGNDTLAVYNAVKAARELAINRCKPVLIEAMTYRVGHHSTSDDSSVYRDMEEVSVWTESHNPVAKFRHYIVSKGWWSEEEDLEWKKVAKKEVMEALGKADKRKKPNPEFLFTDVYDQPPKRLEDQREEMMKHVALYPDHYPLEQHEPLVKSPNESTQ